MHVGIGTSVTMVALTWTNNQGTTHTLPHRPRSKKRSPCR